MAGDRKSIPILSIQSDRDRLRSAACSEANREARGDTYHDGLDKLYELNKHCESKLFAVVSLPIQRCTGLSALI